MAVATQAAPAAQPKRKRTAAQWREIKWGLAFLSPWIAGFVLFTLFPMVASLVFSVTEKTSEAIRGKAVNSTKPMIQGLRKANPHLISRRRAAVRVFLGDGAG